MRNSVTIVVPVYNEEALLRQFIGQVSDFAGRRLGNYEILICENGSTDRTLKLATELAGADKHIKVLHDGSPNYGLALRQGILNASHDHILVLNADLADYEFIEKGRALLDVYDIVIGSKCLHGANGDALDGRQWYRVWLTRSYNRFLSAAFGLPLSDTHGLKWMKKDRILGLVKQCVTNNEIFDSELLIRAFRQGLLIAEIPVNISEVRPPRLPLRKRVFKTAKDLVVLAGALRG